jgi:predicted nucleic acid-binding protein
MPLGRYLLDVSALARYTEPEIAKRLEELSEAGVVVTCGILELELLGALRNAEAYARVAMLRKASIGMLEMSEVDVRRALEVQALLVERGEFRVPWAVLLVAAVAERHGVTVLHSNPWFGLVVGSSGVGAPGR